MALTAMLALELDGIDDARRATFDAYMDSQNWIKVPNLRAVWAADFPNAGAETKQAIYEQAVHAVNNAAKTSGLDHIHAAVHIGFEIPTLFTA